MYTSHIKCFLTCGLFGERLPSYHGVMGATSNRARMLKIYPNGGFMVGTKQIGRERMPHASFSFPTSDVSPLTVPCGFLMLYLVRHCRYRT
jgi:hypothetical protein